MLVTLAAAADNPPGAMKAAVTAADLAALRGIPILAGLAEHDLLAVAEACERERFAPGEILIEQGTSSRKAYILLEGTAEVSVDVELGRVVVAEMGRGTLVGEIALLCEVPRTARVVAASAVTAFVLAPDSLPALVRRAPDFALMLMQAIARRLLGNVEAIAYFKGAAQAIQEDRFDLPALAEIADELQQLRIEIDELRKQRQVAEITGSRQFESLLERAAALRERRRSR
jgi:CRP-like cAMP-binding protein